MTPIHRFRLHSGAARFLGSAGALFFVVGLVFVLFGGDLGRLDAFIEGQGGWLDAMGSFLLRLVFLGLFFAGMGFASMPVVHRTMDRAAVPKDERAGIGSLIAGLLLAYFSWIGVFGDY
jgi:hypothetical protein